LYEPANPELVEWVSRKSKNITAINQKDLQGENNKFHLKLVILSLSKDLNFYLASADTADLKPKRFAWRKSTTLFSHRGHRCFNL
jgi:hypothetical protein